MAVFFQLFLCFFPWTLAKSLGNNLRLVLQKAMTGHVFFAFGMPVKPPLLASMCAEIGGITGPLMLVLKMKLHFYLGKNPKLLMSTPWERWPQIAGRLVLDFFVRPTNHFFLVGGWTHPFEKYARQIESIFPKDRGEN